IATHILNHIVPKNHCCKNGCHITTKKVCSHPGNITYVVPNVICDCSRVTWVIFSDTGFYFSYKVSSNIGSFGIDPSTHTGKKSNRFSSQRESSKSFKHNGHLAGICPYPTHKLMKK